MSKDEASSNVTAEPKGQSSAETRLAESRRRLQSRLGDIGTAVDREVETAQAVRDGFVAILGVAGLLLTARQVSKAVGRKRKKKRAKKKKEKG